MRKRILQGASALLLSFGLIGCNPFTTNLYSSFDKYKMPDLGDVDEVLGAADDPAFYDNLEDDPEAKQEVLDTLEESYSDPAVDDETRQQAALVAVDVHLKTSDTADTLNSFNDLISDAVNGEEVFDADSDGPEALFKSLFGDPPYPDGTSATASARVNYKAGVKVQLEAFLGAIGPLEAYGDNLKAGIPAPPGANPGDMATKALMAGLTRFIAYSLGTNPDPIEDDDVDALADYLADPSPTASLTYVRQPAVPPGEDEVEFYLKDPTDSTNDALVYVVNDGLDLSSLLDN